MDAGLWRVRCKWGSLLFRWLSHEIASALNSHWNWHNESNTCSRVRRKSTSAFLCELGSVTSMMLSCRVASFDYLRLWIVLLLLFLDCVCVLLSAKHFPFSDYLVTSQLWFSNNVSHKFKITKHVPQNIRDLRQERGSFSKPN